MKKILALLLAALMIFGLVACAEKEEAKPTEAPTTAPSNPANPSNPADPSQPSESQPTESKPYDGPVEEITLTVWAPAEDMANDNWLASRLAAFEVAHPEYKITWQTAVCGEGDAKTQVTADPSKAADVYMYANDQMGDLISAGALSKLGGATAKFVKDNFSDTLINTVTYSDGAIYGIPMSNNTWFLYYNKDIFTAEDVKTLDGMLAKAKVAFPMGNAWWSGAFFLGNGCTMFGNGYDASAGMDFGGQKGYDAAAAMLAFAKHPNYVEDANDSGLSMLKSGEIGAMFSGSWVYNGLNEAMGDKLGAAVLPTATIGGKQVQLRAFAGSKAIGVNRHTQYTKAATELAVFLASEESQLTRYEMRNIIPAIKSLASNPTIAANMVAVAEMGVMNDCSVMQPVIGAMQKYWDFMGPFGGNIVGGTITNENLQDSVDLLVENLNGETL